MRGEKLIIRKAAFKDVCRAVYMLVQLIPQGFVTSYSSIARLLGVHPRLVASCLARNREIITIPCHRVVYSNMLVGGYRALGTGFKKRLLQLEGVTVSGNSVLKNHFIDLSKLLENQVDTILHLD